MGQKLPGPPRGYSPPPPPPLENIPLQNSPAAIISGGLIT